MNDRTQARHTTTRNLVWMGLMVAIGVALSPYTSFPVGAARVNPTQHLINVVGGTLYGPWNALLVTLVVSTARNALGTGTLFAFPGSIFGALLAGFTWRRTRRISWTAAAEVVGTGVVGGFASFPLAAFVLGQSVVAWFYVLAFLPSSATGAALGAVIVAALRRLGAVAGAAVPSHGGQGGH